MRERVGCIVGVAILLCLGKATAATYDPDLTWRTVTSQSVRVHYHDEAYNLAVRVAQIAEEELPRVAALFGNRPAGIIDIVIVDTADDANGSATVIPKNTLRLYLAAPTELTGLSFYEEWLRLLVIHELAHLSDIDHVGGPSAFLRAIFGNTIAWNGFTPQFLSEGVAVYAETVLSQAGRGRSSFVAMLLRTAALDGHFLAIDQANILNPEWPGPNGAYFYGGNFHLWLRQKYGAESVRRLHEAYARALLPYFYWGPAIEIFGKSLPELWHDWREEEIASANEIQGYIRDQGETVSRRITFNGRNITGARYSPDGEYILYSRSSPVDGPTVRRINRDGSDDKFLVLDTFSPRSAFTRDGKAFYYSQSAINDRFNDFNDLYRYEFDKGEEVRLRDADNPEKSLRARDPDVSNDGKRVVFVQNKLHQSYVSVGEVTGEDRDQLKVRILIPPMGDIQHASPQFSPDGSLVAVSTWFEGGKRDIIVVDATTGALVRRITHDIALDGNPTFSPDGRYVLYESDADGISNIYAFDLRTQAHARVTRVVGGAFQPDVSSDGKSMLFRNASGIGFDIHEMPFDPSTWIPVTYDPEQGYAEGSVAQTSPADDTWAQASLPTGLARKDEPTAVLGAATDAPYSPWNTLLPFNDNWVLFPNLYTLNGEWTGTLATFGSDVLGQHSYYGMIGAGSSTQKLNWSAGYTYDAWYPTISISGGDSYNSYPTGVAQRAVERRWYGALSIAWPMLERHFAALSYVFRRDSPMDPLSTFFLGPRRNAAYVSAGYAYGRSRSFPYSVSPEHGRSVSIAARYHSKSLGGDFDELLGTVDGRLYLNNPLFDNHVLALRGSSTVAFGPDYRQRVVLGGFDGSSLITAQTENVYSLRGFPLDLSRYPAGTGLAAAYVEYRFPLSQVFRGWGLLPAFLNKLHGAFFADAGTTFGDGSESSVKRLYERAKNRLQGGRVGVGSEARMDIALGWFAPLTLRLGVGFPVVDKGRSTGVDGWRSPAGYFSTGTAL